MRNSEHMSALARYLKARGLSHAEFARQLGMSRGNFSRIVNGRQDLTHEQMRRLYELTGGALTPNDIVLKSADEPEAA